MILLEASIQLVPDGTLLLHLLMVGVMVFILNRTLLKPINQILAEREKHMAGVLKEAEAMALETQEKLKKYNDGLRDARADGYKLLEKERAQGLTEKEEKLRQYREEMAKAASAQMATTRKKEQEERGEPGAQAATIGNLISSQILRRPTR